MIFPSPEALAREPVGLKLIDDDRWQIYFAKLSLGVLDGHLGRIIKPQ
ncbi:MAG: hypothetical protein OER80_06895 [Gammaproteobacteria bacterium]|nr:hypothetical protein [Gammaproteobacteria bacterium]